jgi:hypothetical protein
MKARMTIPLVLSTILVASPLRAQGPVSLDIRAGRAVFVQDVGDDELDAGFGLDGSLGLQLMEHLTVYAGWGWHQFSAAQSFAGSDMDFEETGYAYGLRWEHPFSGETGSGHAFRLRVGGTYDHIEIEDEDGELIADTGHGPGWEVGGGVTFRLTDTLRLSPEARYRALSREAEIGDVTTDLDLQYVAADLGITWSF